MTGPVRGRLGCAERYDAVIHQQGGQSIHARLDGLTAASWGRKLDDYSEAGVSIAKRQAGRDCLNQLASTETWAHELTLYRDLRQVWQGPIVQLDETRTHVNIDARDILAWLDRRAIHPYQSPPDLPDWRQHYMWWQARPAGEVIRRILEDAFTSPGHPDPGLLEHAVIDVAGTPLATTDLMYGDTGYIGPLIREVLQVGMDMYTIGRRAYFVNEIHQVNAQPHRFTEHDFLSDFTVRKPGLDVATRGICVGGDVRDGSGNTMPPFPPAVEGQPEIDYPPVRGAVGGVEPGFGLVEKLTTSENTIQQEVAHGIAAKIRGYGYPAPRVLIVPDGARLAPAAPVDVDELVPGRLWHVDMSSYITPVQALFRLSEVDVSWAEGQSEEVAVSLITTNANPGGTT